MTLNILTLDSYLSTIRNSVGSEIFRTLWAEVDGKKEDILRNGERSCATFVSGILIWFGLIKERHATIAGTVRDMKQSGWEEIEKPRAGVILHWEKALANGEENEHLGFYMGSDTAISNSRAERTPIEHHWTYGVVNGKPNRAIVAIYWHPRLNN